jgi:hypothetical protein
MHPSPNEDISHGTLGPHLKWSLKLYIQQFPFVFYLLHSLEKIEIHWEQPMEHLVKDVG